MEVSVKKSDGAQDGSYCKLQALQRVSKKLPKSHGLRRQDVRLPNAVINRREGTASHHVLGRREPQGNVV